MRQLVLRPGAIGDCILCLPALEHLALGGETDIWISSPVVPLIQFADRVRPLASTGIDLLGIPDVDMPEALVEKLRCFDQIVSWYGGNRPEFREALLGINRRSTFLPALPPTDYAGHVTDFFVRQVGAPLGQRPRLQVDGGDSASRDFVAIHPFSGSQGKNWPLNHFRLVAAQLNTRVEWTAGPDEELPEARRFDTLLDLALWLSASELYLGNDSGITHLAAALGLPTVALFGPTSPSLWAPRGENVAVLRNEPIDELPVDQVLQLVRSLAGG